jgi:hypothetical protein
MQPSLPERQRGRSGRTLYSEHSECEGEAPVALLLEGATPAARGQARAPESSKPLAQRVRGGGSSSFAAGGGDVSPRD